MGKSFKQIFSQRRHTDGLKAQEKTINITNYHDDAEPQELFINFGD